MWVERKTFSRGEWQELNWITFHWNDFTNFPLSQTLPESWMRYGVSLREKKKRKKKAREHCGAIMRADCEVRVGTVSEGMSRLARLVLLQRRGCMFERIHLRIEISCRRVIPLSVRREVNKSPGQCFCPKVSHSPQEAKEAYHTRQSKPDTWGKQRC